MAQAGRIDIVIKNGLPPGILGQRLIETNLRKGNWRKIISLRIE